MIATTTRLSLVVDDSHDAKVLPHRPRCITRDVGLALEKLGHAIEYLTDEYVFRNDSASGSADRMEAMNTLMALRRMVYYDAPERPPRFERVKTLLAQLMI